MTVISDGSRSSVVAVDAADEADDLERVVDRPRPEAQALPGLVELDRERPVHVEVAGRDRQVVRLERAAALLVDDVERADEPDVVDEVGEVPGAPAAVEVADEGRAADRAEDEVRRHRTSMFRSGLRAWQLERRRGGRDERLDLGRVEPDAAARRGRPIAPAAGERVERPVAEDLDPDLGQDPQRGAVDRLDLVGRQDLERPERVDQPAPGQLGETGRGAARPAPRAGARHRDRPAVRIRLRRTGHPPADATARGDRRGPPRASRGRGTRFLMRVSDTTALNERSERPVRALGSQSSGLGRRP